jgi:5-methylcytosine-specific restriction endonuclease McrA
MSRSLKELYPEKYQEYKESKHYKYICSIQAEANAAKQKCKELANYKCAICGEKAIDAHHIIGLKEGGSNEQDNLICLCRSCHQRVHKNVYIIDPETKEIRPNVELNIIDETEKQSYVAEFEKLINLPVFKCTNGYYIFKDNKKIKITASEIKEKVGYQSATQLRNMLPEKQQSIKERALLTKWKKYFKEAGNKPMWHQLCKVIRLWDTFNANKKEEIFEKLNKNFPNVQVSFVKETL